MSTYLKANYGASRYRSLRPEYPPKFYDFIFEHFSEKPKLAVDVGCGTGQATVEVAKRVVEAIGMDHSKAMVELATDMNQLPNLSFRVGDDHAFATEFAPDSVDLVTVAEAAHYFDLENFYKAAHTILKPNGLLVIWGYRNDVIQGEPEATKIVAKYCYDPAYLGRYYDEGLKKFDKFYADYKIPNDLFRDVLYHQNPATTLSDDELLELRRTTSLRDYLAYFRSFSSYQNWFDDHSDATPENDIIAQMTQEILSSTDLTLDSEITIKWHTVYMLGKNK
ncbi:putative S-adenosylmethionine-dependent methyltransferase CRG1 [Wickerhamiella sorbophila]|uniref:Putative S-adenosylmethionine-dependent methyltransferase CRG1 n=1 Tax=Wickerhamiella sorbophila TaxID=45607 RepID=A0A2T0FJ58_9ASCO|nr:putative S-adenosylmethionine-dependent methyltransferase CRG1 [Wickerhamiella sorbophila]PRT55028.1 putative S-adenosylmethionine-dependent methyltransferase CRG1 [Wickerhamiella sorbophila]